MAHLSHTLYPICSPPLLPLYSESWQCSLCRPAPALPPASAAGTGTGLSSEEAAVARRLLGELYSAFYPSIYFQSLESLAVSRDRGGRAPGGE